MPGTSSRKRNAPDGQVGLVALHRCGVVHWAPSPVAAIEACPDGSVVAVARDDGSIEFWETESWTRASVIPGKEEAAINGLVWAFDTVHEQWRLFSVGLDANIVEWDLTNLRPRCVTGSMGGAVWDAAAQPRKDEHDNDHADVVVAIVTDDGAVRLMVAEPGGDGLQYSRSLGGVEAKALSVAWSPDGSVVYAGYSDGCIRAFDVRLGHEVLRITVATACSGAADCIWSLAVLPDGCIVSGSSQGVTQVWEPQFGTLLSSFQQHQADVTRVAASPDGNRIFAAGADPSIALFARTPADETAAAAAAPAAPSRFVYSDRKRPHTHDVRAMAVVSPAPGVSFLVTGGNDAQLLVHSVEDFQRRHPVRICRVPQPPQLSHAVEPVRLASASRTWVDVWSVPDLDSNQAQASGNEGDACPLATPPVHVARVKLPGTTSVLASALSPCGTFVALSSPHETTLLGLRQCGNAVQSSESADAVTAEEPAYVSRLPLPADLPAAVQLAFRGQASGMAKELLAGDARGRVFRVEFDTAEAAPPRLTLLHSFDSKGGHEPLATTRRPAASQVVPAFSHFTISPCSRWLAAGTPSGLHLLDLSAAPGHLHHCHVSVPAADGPVTALAFSHDGSTLAVSTTDVKLNVFDTAKGLPAPWLQHRRELPLKLDSMPGHVTALSFQPGRAAESLLMCTHSAMCHVHLDALKRSAGAAREGSNKRQRGRAKPVFTGDPRGEPVRVMPLQKLCLGLARVSGSVLLVEADWDAVLKQLPLPLLLRQYGK